MLQWHLCTFPNRICKLSQSRFLNLINCFVREAIAVGLLSQIPQYITDNIVQNFWFQYSTNRCKMSSQFLTASNLFLILIVLKWLNPHRVIILLVWLHLPCEHKTFMLQISSICWLQPSYSHQEFLRGEFYTCMKAAFFSHGLMMFLSVLETFVSQETLPLSVALQRSSHLIQDTIARII